MLTLEPLRPDQYAQVAEWEFGPQGDVDWEDYAAYMNEPQWGRFGLYLGLEYVGCISFEQTGRNMAAYHIVTARRKVHPQDLADVLRHTAAFLFNQGFTALTARVPVGKRAAARLALRCGMWEWGHTPTMRYFIMTKKRFEHER